MINTSKIKILLFIIAIVNSKILYSAEENNSVNFTVSLESTEDSGLRLQFSLVNQGKIPLIIQSGLLPWKTRNILQLVAIPFIYKSFHKIVYEKIISPPLLVDDPGYGISFLFPGKIIKGHVSLNKHFPTLHEISKRKDILICWGYPFYHINIKRKIFWYQGYVVISKTNSKFHIDDTWKNTFNKKCSTLLVKIDEIYPKKEH